jgi:hypothetical protein
MGGSVVALLLAGTAFLLSPGFLLFHSLFTPNAVEQFLWLLIIFFIMQLVKSKNPKWWIWIGVLVGLAFLNKYSVVFLALAFFIALLFSPHRYLLGSPYLIWGLAAGLVIISPNLAWQYRHDWPVVYHMAELEKTQLSARGYGKFITEVFSLNLLASGLAIFGLIASLFYREEKRLRYLGLASLLILLLFIFTKGKGYYALGIMPLLFAAGGYAMEKYLHDSLSSLNAALLVLMSAASLLALPYGLPILSYAKLDAYTTITRGLIPYPLSSWEDGESHAVSQVYADMTGWRELTGLVRDAYSELTHAEKEVCTIYAERNYGYAGAVHFYGKRYGLPEPVTFLESYILWAPDSIPRGPLIYINYEIDGLNRLFADIREVGQVRNPWFRENGVKVFLCKSPLQGMQATYLEKARQEKAFFK